MEWNEPIIGLAGAIAGAAIAGWFRWRARESQSGTERVTNAETAMRENLLAQLNEMRKAYEKSQDDLMQTQQELIRTRTDLSRAQLRLDELERWAEARDRERYDDGR